MTVAGYAWKEREKPDSNRLHNKMVARFRRRKPGGGKWDSRS